jgi:eight-cysteine-cluster-containing protein
MNVRRATTILVCAVLAGLAGCRGGAGAPCNGAGDCREGLLCGLDGTCQAVGTDASAGTDAAGGGTDAAGGSDAAAATDAAGGSDAAPGTDAATGTDATPTGTDAGGGVCMGSVDVTDPYYDRFEGDSYENGCLTDSACFVGGCSGEVCAAETAITTCEALPYLPAGTCSCLMGICTWTICG